MLTVAVCYHAKLQFRRDFERYIAPKLMKNKENSTEKFRDEIIRYTQFYSERVIISNFNLRCQEVFLKNMRLPTNIACNHALRENVFMMVVCVELKIPLFLVGKPGSSKSLAKSIVADSMQGAASSSPLFQQLKQVNIIVTNINNCN